MADMTVRNRLLDDPSNLPGGAGSARITWGPSEWFCMDNSTACGGGFCDADEVASKLGEAWSGRTATADPRTVVFGGGAGTSSLWRHFAQCPFLPILRSGTSRTE